MAVPLSGSLAQRVLARLGLAAPPPCTRAGLDALYGAWCRLVPFDNVRKLLALRAAGPAAPLPGIDAADFFEHWLASGTGGTCWPSSNALYRLVEGCGFQARRVAGSMMDTGTINHGSVKVRLDAVDYLVDSSILSRCALPLIPGQPADNGDAGFPVRVEPTGPDGFRVWLPSARGGLMPCRLLDDPVDHAFYRQGYEASRQTSVFNATLFARRESAGTVVVFLGGQRIEVRGEARTVTEPGEDLAALVEQETGISRELVEQALGAAPTGPGQSHG